MPATPTILIVDDTPDNLYVLGELLGEHYGVRAVNSGRRALEAVRILPKPDLILLDVMMPEMDGYECLRRLHEDPDFRDIPVIFVTALDSPEDERHGLELGAVDYVTKPIKPAIVLARIRNHLDMKFARDWMRDQNGVLVAELQRLLEILAHHLQEPVRRQILYSQMLQKYLANRLSPPEEHSLAQIMDGATSLRAMLHDILIYLSVADLPRPDQPCPANTVFDQVRDAVRGKIEASAADVGRDDLPPVWITERNLADILRILLDNALEYRHPDRSPIITVTAERRGAATVLSVTDNGVGIAPEYREQVFAIFERLQPQTSAPGTGMGLALVKRIVEAGGGRTWIEDGRDGGTKVCLSLPGPDA